MKLRYCFLLVLLMACKEKDYSNRKLNFDEKYMKIYIPNGYSYSVDSVWERGVTKGDIWVRHWFKSKADTASNVVIIRQFNRNKKFDERLFLEEYSEDSMELSYMAVLSTHQKILRVNGKKMAYSTYVLARYDYRNDLIFTLYDGEIYTVSINKWNYHVGDSVQHQKFVDSVFNSVVIK